MTVTVMMFKAQRQTNRFRKNQKVWVRRRFGNHLEIRFKYRGKGRYVNGVISRFPDDAPAVELPLREIDVAATFAATHGLQVLAERS